MVTQQSNLSGVAGSVVHSKFVHILGCLHLGQRPMAQMEDGLGQEAAQLHWPIQLRICTIR